MYSILQHSYTDLLLHHSLNTKFRAVKIEYLVLIRSIARITHSTIIHRTELVIECLNIMLCIRYCIEIYPYRFFSSMFGDLFSTRGDYTGGLFYGGSRKYLTNSDFKMEPPDEFKTKKQFRRTLRNSSKRERSNQHRNHTEKMLIQYIFYASQRGLRNRKFRKLLRRTRLGPTIL